MENLRSLSRRRLDKHIFFSRFALNNIHFSIYFQTNKLHKLLGNFAFFYLSSLQWLKKAKFSYFIKSFSYFHIIGNFVPVCSQWWVIICWCVEWDSDRQPVSLGHSWAWQAHFTKHFKYWHEGWQILLKPTTTYIMKTIGVFLVLILKVGI